MKRILFLLYGVVGYAIFFATFLYLVGFVTGVFVPASVDAGGPTGDLLTAVLVDVGLIALFGVQHTIMARPAFKAWLARHLPAALERTTFVLVTCAVFATMFACWRPIGTVVWALGEPLATVVFAVGLLGWGVVLLSTFLIDHFDLFGLRQTWLAFRGKPYTQRPFVERSLYRVVRHPLMFGFLLAFWAAPTMTVSHLVFAGTYTGYILLALLIEERDLVALHGNAYREYQRRVPKLLPIGRPARNGAPQATAE